MHLQLDDLRPDLRELILAARNYGGSHASLLRLLAAALQHKAAYEWWKTPGRIRVRAKKRFRAADHTSIDEPTYEEEMRPSVLPTPSELLQQSGRDYAARLKTIVVASKKKRGRARKKSRA